MRHPDVCQHLPDSIGRCQASRVTMSTIARVVAILTVASAGWGCAAQAEAYDDRDWTVAHGDEGGKWREVEALFGEEADADNGKHVLQGVRHDLTLAKAAQPTVRCSCMDVVVAPSTSDKFRWAGERPLAKGTQLAVAVRTDGAKCPDGVPSKRRPSIFAIDAQGPHIIVVIEELTYDRPQALGAVIAQPKPGGSVWLRSRTYRKKRLPYGWTGLTNTMCKVHTRSVVRPRSGT